MSSKDTTFTQCQSHLSPSRNLSLTSVHLQSSSVRKNHQPIDLLCQILHTAVYQAIENLIVTWYVERVMTSGYHNQKIGKLSLLLSLNLKFSSVYLFI